MRSRPRNTRGLSTYSSGRSSRSSISTPRSSRPGVISAAYISRCAARAMVTARRAGSPARSALSSDAWPSAMRLGDLGADQAIEGSIRKNPRRPPVVGLRFGQGIVQERDRRRLMGSMRACELEEDVGPLHALRNLPEELLEHRHGPLSLAGEAVEARAPNPTPMGQARVVRRQLGGELAELCRRGGRAAGGGLLGRGVELGRGDGVGPLDRSAMWRARSSRSVDRPGESPVDGAPLPRFRLLVADRCEQRVREAKARVIELDDSFSRRGVKSLENVGAVAVGGRHQLDGRPSERGGEEHDVAGLGGQSREAAVEQLVQALGHPSARPASGLVPVRTSSRPSSSAKNGLPADASCTRASSGRVRSSPSPILQQMMKRTQAQRTEHEMRSDDRSGRRSRARAATVTSGARRTVARRLTGSSPNRRKAICSTPADDESSHCRSSSATSTGRARQALAARREARARSRDGSAPPLPARPAEARPRARGVAAAPARAATSSKTGATRSERAEKESEVSASTLRCTERARDAASPPRHPSSQRIVLPIPGSPERTSAAGPARRPARNASIASKLLVAPDDSRRHQAADLCQRRLQGRPASGSRACGRRGRGAPPPCSRPMNSSAAISLFERPRAASSATRRSVSVNSSDAGARPLIRLSSARALSAQSRAPSSSKIASACSSAWRDAFFCCACLRTMPRQSSVRPRSSGKG